MSEGSGGTRPGGAGPLGGGEPVGGELASGQAARLTLAMERLTAALNELLDRKILERSGEEGEKPPKRKEEEPSFGEVLTAGASALAALAESRVRGLYSMGYSGTVQQAQMQSELQQIGRELVAIMTPFLKVMVDVTRGVRVFLGGLNETTQNMLMVGALLTGGVLGGLRMMGLVGGLSSVGTMLGSRGLGLAAGGAVAAAGLMSGGSALAAVGATLAGTTLLGRLMGGGGSAGAGAGGAAPAPAANAGAAAGARAAGAAAGAGAGAAGAAGAGTAATQMVGSGLLAAAKRFGPLLAVGVGLEAMSSDTYARAREAGYSRLTAGLMHTGQSVFTGVGGILDFTGLTDSRAFMQRQMGLSPTAGAGGTAGGGHRSAEVSGGGVQEIGAGFEAAVASISRVQSGTADTEILRSIQRRIDQVADAMIGRQTHESAREAGSSVPAVTR